MNKVFLAGYMQGEPEFHESQKGTSFYVVKIAVTRYFKEVPEVSVIEVSCFGRCAKAAEQYLADGTKVIIEARVASRVYKDKTYISLMADNITPVEALGGDEPKKKTELTIDELSLEDDDIPFN
jgi:hypothetical protein